MIITAGFVISCVIATFALLTQPVVPVTVTLYMLGTAKLVVAVLHRSTIHKTNLHWLSFIEVVITV